jgi:tryptophan-rich sensory protein
MLNSSGIAFVLAAGLLAAQALAQMPAPAKINVAPVNIQNQAGANVPVQVQLQDAKGQPASTNRNTDAVLQVEQPSGQTTTYPITFAPGETAKQITVPIGQPGLARLTVNQSDKRLIGASAFVLVHPAKPPAKTPPPAGQKPARNGTAGPGARLRDLPAHGVGYSRLTFVAFVDPQVAVPTGTGAAPNLALTVSGEDANGGTPADGTSCAVVQVFYLGDDYPQHDIQVWLSTSNGMLDNNPIVIQKATSSGKACWTSRYPLANATLSVAATNPPNYTFAAGAGGADPRTITHKFTDNISGIEFVNPPKSITIVDSFYLTARFMGPSGPVKLSDSREVDFNANSSVLTLQPKQTTVQAGAFDSSTVLVPTFFGESTVQAYTPDYQPANALITITWVGVLFASLLGGAIGGLLGWVNSAGKLWTRIVTGLIVGLVASWAYVIVGLPKLETAFLHNQLSVFFVALIVGLSGVKGIAFIAPKLNLPGF